MVVRNRYSQLFRHDQPSDNTRRDRLTCSICGFKGVDIRTEPGGNFPTAFTITGTTYAWTNADDALSTLDRTVLPVPQVAQSCPFCGGTRFLDGSKGSGNAVP